MYQRSLAFAKVVFVFLAPSMLDDGTFLETWQCHAQHEPTANLSDTAEDTEYAPSDANPLTGALALVSLLSEEQKSKTVLPFDSDQRLRWHFIPMNNRKGLPLFEMDPEQRRAARKLLRSCLSREGYEQALAIMNLERLLQLMENDRQGRIRDPEKFYFTFFGMPAEDQRWGLSVEGHHLSLNFVFEGRAIIDSTPQFLGANPAKLMADHEGFSSGLEPLRSEQALAFRLLHSLDEKQAAKAIRPEEPPRELLNAGHPHPVYDLPSGIGVEELSPSQKEILRELLAAYISKMGDPVAQHRWALIDEAGFDNISFSWRGGSKPGEKHYYVIQGPTFLVEYINVQPDAAGNPANHIHCVWRDKTGGFE